MKQCIICKEIKDDSEFYKQGKRNGKERNYLQPYCKDCFRKKSIENSSPQIHRYHLVKARYGITKDEYDRLLLEFPVCACCSNEFKKNEPTVDHCHITGKVRALLCQPCNAGLGNFKDNKELLLKGIAYLDKYG